MFIIKFTKRSFENLQKMVWSNKIKKQRSYFIFTLQFNKSIVDTS